MLPKKNGFDNRVQMDVDSLELTGQTGFSASSAYCITVSTSALNMDGKKATFNPPE